MGTQSKIGQFADTILQAVRSKDAGYVGDAMTGHLMKVKDIDIGRLENESFLSKIPFLGALVNNLTQFITRYDKLGVQIEKIVGELDVARMNLLRDITILDGL